MSCPDSFRKIYRVCSIMDPFVKFITALNFSKNSFIPGNIFLFPSFLRNSPWAWSFNYWEELDFIPFWEISRVFSLLQITPHDYELVFYLQAATSYGDTAMLSTFVSRLNSVNRTALNPCTKWEQLKQ
jgi:hypothetical protein